ncbi:MAG TPA: response regulator, partial [Usitatibacter sp.]|nr:response regulator [Usitatibacter sp.]
SCADAIALLLNRNGVDAASTYDGREAIVLSERLRPNAVVMDPQLPVVPGLEAARELRRRLGRGLRLVAYTAHPSAVDRACLVEAGFDAWVPKSADPLELLRVMGPAIHDIVVKSIGASVRQMRNQLTLAASLLEHADVAADAGVRRGIRNFLFARIENVVASMSHLPIATGERTELWSEVEALRERVQRYGAD